MTTSTSRASTDRSARTRARALAVLGGAVAALVVWLIADPLLGNDLTVTQGSRVQSINAVVTVIAALAGSLLGWAALEVLERFVDRARTIWTAAAVVLTVLSLLSPLMADADTTTKVTLMIMHIVVAAVVIPRLAATSPRR